MLQAMPPSGITRTARSLAPSLIHAEGMEGVYSEVGQQRLDARRRHTRSAALFGAYGNGYRRDSTLVRPQMANLRGATIDR